MTPMGTARCRRGLARAVVVAAIVVAAASLGPPGTAEAVPGTINVEIDWMADGTHSHRPTAAEIGAIQQMFACHGITLNAVVDDSIPHLNVIPDGAGTNDFFTWVGTNSFASLKSLYFNGGAGWHYCIFAHQFDPEGPGTISGSSGLGELGGNDFIVTLGSFPGQVGTPFDRAATFAHELGHNLGLNHYAGADSVVGAFSPNYASIMSYQYQLNGIRTQMVCLDLVDSVGAGLLKEIDYSNGRFPGVNENALLETRGVGIRSIDWDCSGSVSGTVVKDLDGDTWCAAAGARTFLYDQNDWALLVDNSLTGPLPPSTSVACITSEEVERMKMSPATCAAAQPTLQTEACLNGTMVWVSASFGGVELGTGEQPFNTFLEGYNSAPFGSALFLQPTGSYSTGGVVTLNKPLTIAGPGVVTITP